MCYNLKHGAALVSKEILGLRLQVGGTRYVQKLNINAKEKLVNAFRGASFAPTFA